jgi:hypothetical protein
MQQHVALEIENPIQQHIGLNRNIFSFPWGHHVTLLDKTTSLVAALFFTH